MSADPVRHIADYLVREGFVDNETDALLAAIRLHVALRLGSSRSPTDDASRPAHPDGTGRPRALDIADLMMHRL